MLLNPTYELLLQQIKKDFPHGKISIVDYGCGNGYLLELLPLQKIQQYTGWDVNPDSLEVGRKRALPPNFAFRKMTPGKIPNLGGKESVDLVILIGVLQYMTDAETAEFFEHAYRVLKPGGRVIASCVVDRKIYSLTNLYRLMYPNRTLDRSGLEKQLEVEGYKLTTSFERGILINPIFFHGAVLFFDAIDYYVFGTRGRLGLVGKTVRRLVYPFLKLEYLLPIDFGYTWIFSAQKPFPQRSRS